MEPQTGKVGSGIGAALDVAGDGKVVDIKGWNVETTAGSDTGSDSTAGTGTFVDVIVCASFVVVLFRSGKGIVM